MMKLVNLFYDVPTNADLDHPSQWLRGIAVRLNGSVWLMHESDLPSFRVLEMEREGVDWFTLPVDTTDAEHILKIVTKKLVSEIREVVASAQSNCDTASLRAERSKKTAKEVEKGYRYRCNAIIKDAGKKIQQYRKAAQRFGVSPESLRLPGARQTMESLRSAVLEKCRAYAEAAREVEARSPGSPMAKAARKGQVPAAILADYAQDNARTRQDEQRAERLRNLFAD